MYTQKFSSGQDAQNAAAKESQKRRIQMEILIIESDTRKLFNEKNQLDVDIRKLTRDADRVRVELDGKKNRLARVIQDEAVKEEELRKLRKNLNLL